MATALVIRKLPAGRDAVEYAEHLEVRLVGREHGLDAGLTIGHRCQAKLMLLASPCWPAPVSSFCIEAISA